MKAWMNEKPNTSSSLICFNEFKKESEIIPL